jgi:hypothetical protein
MHSRIVVVSRAAHHSAHLHRMISHQVAAQNQRNTRLVLSALADRFICALDDTLVRSLGASSDARRVTLSAERFRHILEARQVAAQVDVDLAAHRIGEALAAVRFVRIPQRRPNIFELIGYVASADRLLLVALNLVPAARAKSGEDEWWVQTSHPLGRKRTRKLEASGQLRRVLLVR